MGQKITFGLDRQKEFDFGFPYIRQERPDGTNYGYVDLKKQPELIATIPELAGWDELEMLVRQLNSKESIFKTVGCEAGVLNYLFEDFSKKVGCYVHVAFDAFEFNADESYYDLIYSGLYYHAQEYEIKGRAHVHGILKPTRFQDLGGLPGWTLNLDISGLGNDEARSAWSETMPIIAGAFERISDGWETIKLQVKKRDG